MSDPIPVCKIDDIPVGEGREFAVNGKVIAIFRMEDDEFHAIDGLCPHAGGPIGTGALRKGVVTCPWHGWQFDVRTGKHCHSDSIRTTTYSVSLDAGNICIAMQ